MKNAFLDAIKETHSFKTSHYRELQITKIEAQPDTCNGDRVCQFLVQCKHKPNTRMKYADNAVEYKVSVYKDGHLMAFYERDYFIQ